MDNDIFIKNKILRDYDKEPIVLKNYEVIYQILLFPFSLIFSLFGGVILYLTFSGKFDNFIECLAIIILFLVLYIAVVFFLIRSAKETKSTIYFKNNTIEFYELGVLKKANNCANLDDIICKPITNFGVFNNKLNMDTKIVFIFLAILFIANIFLSDETVAILLFILAVIVLLFLGNFLTKIIFAFLFAKAPDRLFTIYSAIIIDEPYYKDLKYLPSMFKINQPARYYMIITFSKNEYRQIKEWFLTRQNINIDNIKKSYFPL